jgi:hypothetical protein
MLCSVVGHGACACMTDVLTAGSRVYVRWFWREPPSRVSLGMLDGGTNGAAVCARVSEQRL